jgi:formate hydrogenlyase transcriptional activator
MKKPAPQKTPLDNNNQAKQLPRGKAVPARKITRDGTPAPIHELQPPQGSAAKMKEKTGKAQLEFEESRSRFLELYDHAPVGYFTFDEQGRILTANHTGSRQLGQGTGSIVNRTFSSFMGRDDGDLFHLHLKKVFTTGSKESCILTLRQVNGQQSYVQLDSTLSSKDSDPTPVCQTTITEVNERRELEEALKTSSTLYRGIFAAARDGLLLLDAETGRITDANPFLMEMLDYSYEDLIGKKLWDIDLFKGLDASKITFCESQNRESVHFDNVPFATKNGRLIALENFNSVCLVNHHAVIQCSIRDITGQKEATDRDQGTHEGMERGIKERLAERQASDEALDQERAKFRQTEKSLANALEEIKALKNRLVTENIYFRQEPKGKDHSGQIIGQSDGLKYVLYRAEQVAPTDTTVLILGETGTGKELIASAIHAQSPRRDKPMITVNCAALPANLLESELFGREKGAFTGADSRQIGRFELANGSTLCLDEIGEMPLEMQAKLLRVIQHNEFERLGSSKTIKVDVRIIATTNRNFEDAIRAGTFRQDLYYRLNVFPITIPPLRQRIEDIPLMVEAFVQRYARKLGKVITSIPKETMKMLLDYPWPGNVRELESIIERAVILCPGPVFQLMDRLTSSPPPLSSSVGTMEEMERQQITKALTETAWRIEGKSGAAMILGLHPSTLRAKMHKLGIVRPVTRMAE